MTALTAFGLLIAGALLGLVLVWLILGSRGLPPDQC